MCSHQSICSQYVSTMFLIFEAPQATAFNP
jgi:hypothetical protein